MKKFLCFLFVAVAFMSSVIAQGKDPVKIGNRRELFIDNLIVDRIDGNAQRVFHQPIPREIVMTFDQPWEGNSSGYITIFRDEDLYRMYYRTGGRVMEKGTWREIAPNVTAYAESLDGIHWTRPALGIHEHEGSKENNIVYPLGHVPLVVFRDQKPGCPPEMRYKAILAGRDHREDFIGGGRNLFALKSGDGIHWTLMQEEAIYDKRHRGLEDVSPDDVLTWLDSQNLAFWSVFEQQYVMYYRVYTYDGEPQTAGWVRPADYFQKRVRHVEKAVSDDFLNWRRVGLIDAGEDLPALEDQFYTNGIGVYHRAPHIYIGLPGMYRDRGWTPAMEQLPDVEKRKAYNESINRPGPLGDVQLMWSRDGLNFEVSPSTFLPPGPERPDAWDYSSNWLAWHMVETKSTLEGAATEHSFYAKERGCMLGKGDPGRLRRYTLRMDGFASIHATRQGGELITRPIIFDGSALSMNFATSASGSIRVELQDANGTPIPGFTLDDSIGLFGDTVARNAMWQDNPDMSALAGKPVRLRFVMRDADLYSIKFE